MNTVSSAALSAVIESRLKPFKGVRLLDVRPLHEVKPDLDPDVLLHAGPPIDSADLAWPLRNAAVHALVFEGRYTHREIAWQAIEDGTIRLEPAQDHGVVTPLAQIVSCSMPVFVVGDDDHCAYAPIAEGPPPALRFGSADPACVERMRRQADWARTELAPLLREQPLPIADWIGRALAEGDECHARTGVANAALLTALPQLSADYAASIAANANFVLPILMAASTWAMARGRGSITALGGNGHAFGARFAGETHWRTVAATAPVGLTLDGRDPAAPLLGAVGDSAVIDGCGLGGQALAFAPELSSAWAAQLPEDWRDRPDAVIDTNTGLVCRHRITASGQAPMIHLAMVDGGREGGLAGRGSYQPPRSLFEAGQAEPER